MDIDEALPIMFARKRRASKEGMIWSFSILESKS